MEDENPLTVPNVEITEISFVPVPSTVLYPSSSSSYACSSSSPSLSGLDCHVELIPGFPVNVYSSLVMCDYAAVSNASRFPSTLWTNRSLSIHNGLLVFNFDHSQVFPDGNEIVSRHYAIEVRRLQDELAQRQEYWNKVDVASSAKPEG